MLAVVSALQQSFEAIAPLSAGGAAASDAAVRAWRATCADQPSLDEFVWNLFKLRYGDQDKIAAHTSHVPSTTSSGASQQLSDAIDGFLDTFRNHASVRALLWEPALVALLRVTKSSGANPVIRKQCYRFMFDWVRSVLSVTGTVDLNTLFSLQDAADPLPICCCGGFPSGDPPSPCMIHGTDDTPGGWTPDGDTVWLPVPFRWVVSVFCCGLTDIWSAIRKDSSTRIFGIVDVLPMQYVQRIVTSLVRIIAIKDKRET